MKVFDLECERGHLFEGWFGSSGDFVQQQSEGQIECPLCGSSRIEKRLSAPRLNLGGHGQGDRQERPQEQRLPPTPSDTPATVSASGLTVEIQAEVQAVQALWLRMARHLARHTEDVGHQFADEVRRIRDEEAPDRPIRGVATARETQALVEDGIEVFSFPMPKDVGGSLQ